MVHVRSIHNVEAEGNFIWQKTDPQFSHYVLAIDVTTEEMDSHLLPGHRRDFCARQLMEYQRCMYDNYPFFPKCYHQLHAYGHCEYEE